MRNEATRNVKVIYDNPEGKTRAVSQIEVGSQGVTPQLSPGAFQSKSKIQSLPFKSNRYQVGASMKMEELKDDDGPMFNMNILKRETTLSQSSDGPGSDYQ
jgi:hypothetical protein